MKKTTRIGALLVVASVLTLGGWIAEGMVSRIPETPALAVKAFYERDVAEDQIMDPLILAGPGVIQILEKDLLDQDMPRRRYAIGALGNLKSVDALPVLEKLVMNDAEIDYIRCDALGAIAMIDKREGMRVANAVQGDGCLSEIAAVLDSDYEGWLESMAPRRTYLQALIGRHS